jgi:hypothetical protein
MRRIIAQGQIDIDPAQLHTRVDEEPDVANVIHEIDRDLYMYPGCTFCGHETHRVGTCPNKPRRRPKPDVTE